MKIGRIVELEDVGMGWIPVAGGVEYTDVSGARVFIPMALLVRLYEGVKHQHEQACVKPWEDFCKNLFSTESE